MAAAAIMLSVTLAGGLLLSDHLRLSGTTRNRVAAANLAEQQLQILAAGDVGKANLGRTTRDVMIGLRPFTVTTDLRWIEVGATTGPCEGTAEAPAYIRADVAVTWANMDARPVTASTVVRPAQSNSQRGVVRARITDSAGAPQPGIPTTLSMPDGTSQSQTSDASGCVSIPFLPLASYTLTVSVPGYAQPDGTATASHGFTLTADSPVSEVWSLTYEEVEAS